MSDGLFCHLGNIHQLSRARSRSISPENPTGGKGMGAMAEPDGQGPARDLGRGWKVRPYEVVEPGAVQLLADIEGPGCIQHIWMTPTGSWRWSILRVYWDDQEQPSIELPLADFFCSAWGSVDEFVPVVSAAICVNPGSAFNSYWPMPFRRRCRITLENLAPEKMTIFWQIDYALGEVGDDAAYLHAQFRRTNPLPYGDVYTILDGVRGRGHYVGTYLAWGVNNDGWWGEGEVKFHLDGDGEFPTICGTGTEDYFCGSYDFEDRKTRRYVPYNTPYAGLPHVRIPDGLYRSQQRFSMYRWHIPDPIRFEQDIRVTVQALGWRKGGKFLPLQDDIASVAWWYQELPTGEFPELPDRDSLEVI